MDDTTLPALSGEPIWDDARCTWVVDGQPVPPGRYMGSDGELVTLVDVTDPVSCII